jgi:hypothetical protein
MPRKRAKIAQRLYCNLTARVSPKNLVIRTMVKSEARATSGKPKTIKMNCSPFAPLALASPKIPTILMDVTT